MKVNVTINVGMIAMAAALAYGTYVIAQAMVYLEQQAVGAATYLFGG